MSRTDGRHEIARLRFALEYIARLKQGEGEVTVVLIEDTILSSDGRFGKR